MDEKDLVAGDSHETRGGTATAGIPMLGMAWIGPG